MTQMLTLPAIFTPEKRIEKLPTVSSIQSDIQWSELVAHLSQFNELGVPETKTQFQEILDHESNPDHQAILLSGLARCIIREGDVINGAATLGEAYSMISAHNQNGQAVILLEMVAFLAMIGNFESAMIMLDKIPALTNSTYLLKLANYYLLVNKARSRDHSVLPELIESAKYFKKIKFYSTLAYHYKVIGNVYRWKEKYNKADHYYNLAMKIAETHGYIQVKSSLFHDAGMLEKIKGNPELALELLDKALLSADDHYTRAFTMNNIALIKFHQEKFDEAMSILQNALEILNDNGIFNLIPGTCYYIGKCYEMKEHYNAAKEYLKKAYIDALSLLNLNFPFNGNRKLAVTGYTTFLEKHNLIDGNIGEDTYLAFTVDKTFNEIRGIFQKSLIIFLTDLYGTHKKAAENLNVPIRTLSDIKKRTIESNHEEVYNDIVQFARLNMPATWDELNRQFEGEMLNYLTGEYPSKKFMSKKLNISYPHLVKLTLDIDNSLPNSAPVQYLNK